MTSDIVAAVLEVVAYAAFGVLSVLLTVVDVREHRLPDRLVLPAYPVGAVLLGSAALVRGEPARLVPLLGGAAALFAFYLALRLVSPGAMGGGDVKLAGVVGLFLGYLGWEAVLAGAFAGFLAGGAFAVLVLVVRRAAARRRAIAFGPWMLLGAWAVVIAAWGVSL